jgi:hypothetical protein
MSYDEDDVPLALLKKQRLSSTDYSSPLSDIEMAAISLTNLQHATLIRGPVYDFLNTPLLGTPVWPSDMNLPTPTAAHGLVTLVAAHCIPSHQNLHLQQHFQSKSSLQTRHSSPSLMELQQATPTPAYAAALPTPFPASAYVADLPTPPVATTQISPSRRFIRANRGWRNNSATAAGTATSTVGHIINQEERRVRPPPNP